MLSRAVYHKFVEERKSLILLRGTPTHVHVTDCQGSREENLTLPQLSFISHFGHATLWPLVILFVPYQDLSAGLNSGIDPYYMPHNCNLVPNLSCDSFCCCCCFCVFVGRTSRNVRVNKVLLFVFLFCF